MADYAISNVPRRVVYAASGTGPYAFTFEILNQTDIAVYKASTLLTLTTDYTVTINANGTGSVTLVVTAGTSNITIVGAKNIQRTTDFTTGGDLFANTLNDELDNQTIFIQQVAETAERGLKAPVVDPTDINMTLPAKASRVGTVLAFNATTGNPEAGPSIGSVTTVAAQSANINTVATNIGSVNTVAGNITNVNTVAGISSNVTTIASNIANVNAVGADLLEGTSEINTVAVDIANVNNVGNNISNVNTVAGISANVTSVAGNASNINTVAGNNGNVTTVAGISGNVTTVAGISANVTTVAGINAAVSTVATNNANVSTVATNIASVNTNATNIVAIQNASTNATNAATSATAAQTAQSAAESARDATLAAYDNFDDRYLGSKTSNPTLDNDGNALAAGALYFNSVSGAMQVYTGSAWVAAYVSGTGFLASANNLSDVASASSSRTNLGLGTIATQAASSVAITGGSINGTQVGASTASTGRFSTLEATGVTTVSAGSVSAPSITTTGDTNTGIFFPAADTIAFAEGGVESMRITSAGDVGIGTTSPVNNSGYGGLTLNGVSGSIYSMMFNGTENLRLFAGNNEGSIQYGSSGVLTFVDGVSGGTERMRINSDGRFGIGVSSITGKLDILTSLTSTAFAVPAQGSIGGASNQRVNLIAAEPGLMINSDINQSGVQTGTGTLSFGLQIGVYNTNDIRSQVFWSGTSPLTFTYASTPTGSPTERMRITSAGNVQLSTASTSILNSSGRPILNQTGGILQVVDGTLNTGVSTSSRSFVDTGLQATITPSSTSSRIFILINTMTSLTNFTQRIYFQVSGGNTASYVGAAGTGVECSMAMVPRVDAAGYIMQPVSLHYVDSPATTSAITYKLQWWCETETAYINRPAVQDGNGANTMSTITLMEIAG